MSLSRIAFASQRVFLRASTHGKKCFPTFNKAFMNTLIQEKGKGDEDAYFRKVDLEHKAKLRASFEKILESEGSAEKQEILEILGGAEEPKEKSLFSKLGFDDWKFALPISMMVGIPIVTNEVLIINEETQLLACFILFCATAYNSGAPIVHQYCEDIREKDFKLFQAADEYLLRDLTEAVKANEKCLGMESTVKDIYTLTDNLSVAQADLLNSIEQHKLRDAIAKKLGSLVAIEEAASSAIRTRMLNKVRSDVVNTFTSDKAAKDNALSQAISVLASGASGKLGKDVVGESFKNALSSYRTAYSKLPAGGDEILVQLEKDVAEVVKIPAYDSLDAGNVYVTHPMPGFAKA